MSLKNKKINNPSNSISSDEYINYKLNDQNSSNSKKIKLKKRLSLFKLWNSSNNSNSNSNNEKDNSSNNLPEKIIVRNVASTSINDGASNNRIDEDDYSDYSVCSNDLLETQSNNFGQKIKTLLVPQAKSTSNTPQYRSPKLGPVTLINSQTSPQTITTPLNSSNNSNNNSNNNSSNNQHHFKLAENPSRAFNKRLSQNGISIGVKKTLSSHFNYSGNDENEKLKSELDHVKLLLLQSNEENLKLKKKITELNQINERLFTILNDSSKEKLLSTTLKSTPICLSPELSNIPSCKSSPYALIPLKKKDCIYKNEIDSDISQDEYHNDNILTKSRNQQLQDAIKEIDECLQELIEENTPQNEIIKSPKFANINNITDNNNINCFNDNNSNNNIQKINNNNSSNEESMPLLNISSDVATPSYSQRSSLQYFNSIQESSIISSISTASFKSYSMMSDEEQLKTLISPFNSNSSLNNYNSRPNSTQFSYSSPPITINNNSNSNSNNNSSSNTPTPSNLNNNSNVNINNNIKYNNSIIIPPPPPPSSLSYVNHIVDTPHPLSIQISPQKLLPRRSASTLSISTKTFQKEISPTLPPFSQQPSTATTTQQYVKTPITSPTLRSSQPLSPRKINMSLPIKKTTTPTTSIEFSNDNSNNDLLSPRKQLNNNNNSNNNNISNSNSIGRINNITKTINNYNKSPLVKSSNSTTTSKPLNICNSNSISSNNNINNNSLSKCFLSPNKRSFSSIDLKNNINNNLNNHINNSNSNNNNMYNNFNLNSRPILKKTGTLNGIQFKENIVNKNNINNNNPNNNILLSKSPSFGQTYNNDSIKVKQLVNFFES